MSKAPLYAHILLDRSGSMESCRDITIDAFNEYVMGLRRSDTTDARLSLTIFDSESIDTLQHLAPAKGFMELSRETYVPRATTPLLDAIGHVVAETDKIALRDGEKVAIVILTDGQENASKEFKKDAIKALLEGRQRDKGWMITFLGAEIDAFTEADAIGLSNMQSAPLSKQKLKFAMGATREAHERYAKSGNQYADPFSSAQRAEMNKD